MRRIYPIDIIRRRLLAAGAASAVLATAPAQAQRRLWMVGYIGAGSAANDYAWLAAFRKGMADLRHNEGQTYVIDARFGDGAEKVLVSRIDDLVSLNPDVILTPGDGTLPMLLARAKSIPIVFATPSDPVRMGFVKTLPRPGGNATGLSSQAADPGSKRMQLLREAFPRITHVALLFEPQHPSGPSQV